MSVNTMLCVFIDYAKILRKRDGNVGESISVWCYENIPTYKQDQFGHSKQMWWVHYMAIGERYYFVNEEDAILFKLTWAQYVGV